MIYDGQVPMICCGEKMKEVEPNTVEASAEKHLPVVTVNGEDVNVKIGSAAHPMSEDHYIQWVYVETERGGQRKGFKPGETPNSTSRLWTISLSRYLHTAICMGCGKRSFKLPAS